MIRKQDVAGLVSLLSDQNPTRRRAIVDGLRRLCGNSDPETEVCDRVVASLTRLLIGPDPELARWADITLEGISCTPVVRRLLLLLQESLQPDARSRILGMLCIRGGAMAISQALDLELQSTARLPSGIPRFPIIECLISLLEQGRLQLQPGDLARLADVQPPAGTGDIELTAALGRLRSAAKTHLAKSLLSLAAEYPLVAAGMILRFGDAAVLSEAMKLDAERTLGAVVSLEASIFRPTSQIDRPYLERVRAGHASGRLADCLVDVLGREEIVCSPDHLSFLADLPDPAQALPLRHVQFADPDTRPGLITLRYEALRNRARAAREKAHRERSAT